VSDVGSVVLPNGEWFITRSDADGGLQVVVRERYLGNLPIASIDQKWESSTQLDVARAIVALPQLVDAMREMPPHLTRRPPIDAECHRGITTQTHCPECKRYGLLLDARSALGFEPIRPMRR